MTRFLYFARRFEQKRHFVHPHGRKYPASRRPGLCPYPVSIPALFGKWPQRCFFSRYTVAALFLIAFPALAHDGHDQLSAWYRSLKSPVSGISCCSEQDCSPVEARLTQTGWQIREGDTWRDVPPEVVIHTENLEGQPVACVMGGAIRCFVPAGET